MAAAFSIYDRNITLTPFFEGSNTFKGGIEHGGLEALVVDLIVWDLSTKISVSIPEHTNSADEPKKLKFSCIRSGASTRPDSLRLSIDQIKNLVIRVGTFEKGRPVGPKIMDTRTGEVSQQQTLIRDDVITSLKLPESLEPHQKYRLIVSSHLVVPNTNIAEKPADLNRLCVEELEKRFEAAFIQDKKHECERHLATLQGNTQAMNDIIAREKK